jgi:hypothetical protein
MLVCSGSREGWKRWRAVTWRSFNGELRRGGVCALHVLSARVVSAFAESAGVPRCFLFVQVTLPAPFAPLAIGLAVVVGAFAAGPFTGGAMNPARALGPAIAFWNFKNIWVYLLANFMGGMSGAVIYENLFLEVGRVCWRSVGCVRCA